MSFRFSIEKFKIMKQFQTLRRLILFFGRLETSTTTRRLAEKAAVEHVADDFEVRELGHGPCR